ncbi:VWA domain-containing protein [Sulfidibacter corallicola]|uniref:VWA domain-containing protein n=1 Tax=Sulfidibacter corallicola TaxID=2818388 RepID=A0A8A4TKM6_SULCO|nr:VWA domain-containing protein [Sulfidibacter corallicola]QTD50559.1 VWA domain-containing protein [Sulfidibacter corallicola]
MRFWPLVPLCLSLCLGWSLASEPVQENLRVVFRDVRVHVTDRDGKPIKGLSAEDFKVVEDGKGHRVAFFEEVDLNVTQPTGTVYHDDGLVEDKDPDAPKQEGLTGERIMVLVIDSSNMTVDVFPEFIKVVHDFIDNAVKPGDFVKVVQLEDGLMPLSRFTTEKSRMHEAVDRAQHKGALYHKLAQVEDQVIGEYSRYLSPNNARLSLVMDEGGRGVAEERSKINTDQGRRLQHLEYTVRQKHVVKSKYFQTYVNGLEHLAHVLRPMSGNKSIYLFTGGQYVLSTSLIDPTKPLAETLSDSLNAANTTLYSLIYIPQRAIGQSVRESQSIRVEGLTNPLRKLGSKFQPIEGTVLEDTQALTSGPFHTSENTGGIMVAAHALGGFAKASQKFQERVNHYYRLGYTVEVPKKTTRVKVSLAGGRSGAKLTYGDRFRPLKSYLEMNHHERAVDFESSILFSQSRRNDLNAEIGYVGFPKPEGPGALVPIFLQLPVDRVPENGFELGFVTLNERRERVDLVTSVVKPKVQGKQVLFYDVLLPPEMPRFVRAKIIDLDNGQESILEMPCSSPDSSGESLHISQMVFYGAPDSEMVPLNHIRFANLPEDQRQAQAGQRKMMDPLAMEKYLFKPAMTSVLPRANEYYLFFQLRHLNEPVQNYQVNYQVMRGGEPVEVQFQVTDAYQPQTLGNAYHFVGTLAGPQLTPGAYELTLTVSGSEQSSQASLKRSFTIGD